MRQTRCLLAALALAVPTGCATLQQLAALRNVDFTLDRVSDVYLAGIDLARIDSYEDLTVTQVARLALGLRERELPMDFEVHLLAENPADNATDARLVRMDWTLLLQGRETLSGTFADEVLLPPGRPTDVPIGVSLNLVEFFEGSGRDLVELALAISGRGGAPKEIALEATPVVDTALGPMRYPRPITIVSREVGG